MRADKAHGFALIDLIFVCGIIGLLCGIALPRLLLVRQSASAASAVGSMRAINSGELTYALTCGSGFYAPKLTTLGVPPPGTQTAYLTVGLTEADTITKSGYIITLSGTPYASSPPTCNGLGVGEAAQAFKAGADPTEPTNPRFFATNANGTIFEDVNSMFAGMPEIGQPASGHPYR